MEICIPFKDARLELGNLLLKHSYKKGTFTLTSGKQSDFYIDCRCTALIPRGGFCIGTCFLYLIAKNCPDVQAIAGMTMGADPLITATSMVALMRGFDLPQIIIRKEAKGHGTGKYLEEAATVPRNAQLVLVDDVLTTGGTLLKSTERINAQGHTVKHIIMIVDREEGAREMLISKGFIVHSIFTRTELLALQS
ncbi:MAG: Orotate phosphoribosyltransferase [uncultured bacterium]|nr:MAG: Orotate phosphoribosyltransferase [uncultured bacterium]HCU70331.1 orotate phosphoribosyltransferase [Candidatus Moranbacteria bacterium]